MVPSDRPAPAHRRASTPAARAIPRSAAADEAFSWRPSPRASERPSWRQRLPAADTLFAMAALAAALAVFADFAATF